MRENKFRILILLCCLIPLCYAQAQSKDELKVIKMFTKDLKSDEESERYEAAERLQYYKYPDVVSALSQALQDPSASVRNRAALSLYEMKEAAAPATPALLQALQDDDAFVRINAAATLMNLKVDESKILPFIKEVLKDPAARNRVAAVRFLQGNVPFTELMPVLSSALNDGDETVREDAAKEFDVPETLPAEALPILVEALKDESPKVRKAAASALDSFKSKGAPAIPPLIQTLKDSDSDVRFEAIDALVSMGTWAAPSLPALYEVARKDPDPGIRKAAVRAFEWIDPEGRTSVPVLLEVLKDQDAEVRERALDTMLSLRPFPTQSVPAVQKALASESNERVKMLLQRVSERGEQEKSYRYPDKPPVPMKEAQKTTAGAMPKEEAESILREEGVQMTTDEFWNRVHGGDAKIVKAMLSAGFSPNTEIQGMSPLMAAVRYYDGEPEKKEVALALIAFGADVNYRDDNNTTPFFYAAGKFDPDVLRAMIKAGAVLEVTANGGATTLSEAVMANNVENVRFLLKSGYNVKKEPTWLMATAKNPEIQKLLRSAGVK